MTRVIDIKAVFSDLTGRNAGNRCIPAVIFRKGRFFVRCFQSDSGDRLSGALDKINKSGRKNL